MAVINILDKHVAELIAAGEVVERPASVVKELLENAIDAKATSVTVSIEKGGIELIQIVDDGTGIDSEYIQTAFIRHATSKIQNEDDLENITTLGFRGEALASIASVAKVELLTKTKYDEYAGLFIIHGGVKQSFEAAARPTGTTITVKELFYNTPARMKFLKKDASEANFVSDIIIQQALSHPEISFKFIKDGKLQYQTLGDGNIISVAYNLFSADFAKNLIEISYTDENYSVKGCVTSPYKGRASRAMQYFFVNNRYVKNSTMTAAMETAYRGILMHGKFPGGIIFLNMPPQLVDVNVHPAKTQVRFAREKDVFNTIYKAVKSNVLLKQDEHMQIELDSNLNDKTKLNDDTLHNTQQDNIKPVLKEQTTQILKNNYDYKNSINEEKLVLESINSDRTNVEKYSVKKSFLPVSAKPSDIYPEDIIPMPLNSISDDDDTMSEEKLVPYKPDTTDKDEYFNNSSLNIKIENENEIQQEVTQTSLLKEEQTSSESLRFVGEVFNTYIITQRNDEMCLIDKHAAHERILYEKIMATYGNVASQMLLQPLTVQLSAKEKNVLLQNVQLLADSGIEIEDFGANSVILRAIPQDIEQTDLENFVIEIANKLIVNYKNTISEKTSWVLNSISCRSAIKGGDKSAKEELYKLAKQILNGEIPLFCPHGRPVVLKITKKEVEKFFGRQG